MGYRSMVAIKCEPKAFEMFENAYKEVEFWPNEILVSDESDEKILVWDWVKWFDDYPDIQAIESVMSKLDESEYYTKEKTGYKMIRLGESDDDIEVRDNGSGIEFYYIRQFDTEGFRVAPVRR